MGEGYEVSDLFPQVPRSINDIVQECISDSLKWFPGVATDMGFLNLALGGEVGEAMNMLKKHMRGSIDLSDPDTALAFREEYIDVFIYLMNIFGLLSVDVYALYDYKRKKNIVRFGPADG
jgi:NTP pyrophosphatase (non-canonical NTP hydrolase)